MNPLTEARLRNVRLLRGWGALIVAAVLAACVILVPYYGQPARAIGGILVVVICVFGVSQIRLGQRTPRRLLVRRYVDPNLLPLAERIRFFRRQLILSAVIFPAASAWFAHELEGVEAGRPVHLWWPIALLYTHCGYRAAVLAVPIIGVIVCGVLAFKLNHPGPGSEHDA